LSIKNRIKVENQLSDIEQKILAAIQHGLPESKNPFKEIAEKIGIETDQLLQVLQEWKEQGKIRRIGAIVNHFKVGLGGGAMVVWQVEPEQTDSVGKLLAGFKEVSHAYERRTDEKWPYNLYTMVHGKSEDDVLKTVQRMSRACGISNYRMLVTEKELKKAPPTYIK
jgi:DNA-binding Lrp family transcriptional regulator